MNILLINYEYPPIGGGAGNATHFMGQALSKLGHNVTVLTTAWESESGTVHKNKVKVIRLPSWRKSPSAASTLEKLHFLWLAKKELHRVVRDHKTEAAIIYFTIPCGPLGLTLKSQHNLPYVISLRGGDVPGLVPEIDWIHWLIRPIRRKVLQRAKNIIANAEGLANLSRKADPYPVSVISNGVDTDFYQPPLERSHDLNSSTTEFLFVGRFHPQKNLESLLKQFARLKKETTKKFKFHLVGSGPLEEELKSLGDILNLKEELVWHGWMNKNELKQLHQSSHIFVNPSHYEGLPNAVLEAMASGLIIIVSDVPGNIDLIPEGFGYSYPHPDEKALFLVLKEAHLHPNFNFGTKARERAIENYSWKKVAQEYVELF